MAQRLKKYLERKSIDPFLIIATLAMGVGPILTVWNPTPSLFSRWVATGAIIALVLFVNLFAWLSRSTIKYFQEAMKDWEASTAGWTELIDKVRRGEL